jgi:hypothetical protein
LKRSKKKLGVALLLAAVLVSVCGCASGGTVAADPAMLAQLKELRDIGQIDGPDPTASKVQEIDQTVEEQGITLQVRQVYGDEQVLCVLYDITYPESIDPQKDQGILPNQVTLQEEGADKQAPGGAVQPLEQNGQTVTYLSEFLRDKDTWGDGKLTFSIDYLQWETRDVPVPVSDASFTLTWSQSLETPAEA